MGNCFSEPSHSDQRRAAAISGPYRDHTAERPQTHASNWNLPPGPAPEPARHYSPEDNVVQGKEGIGRKTGEAMIISYDIGTTASGCAYMYRDDRGEIAFGPEVIDQWPGQTSASLGKTPSILLYNHLGQCQPEWGAECLLAKWAPQRLTTSGLQRVEWFKLHVEPETVPPAHFDDPYHQLPHNVTVWQIYTDFLTRLHKAAVARIRSRRGQDLYDRLASMDKIQFILTIPAAWQKPSIVGELRQCAVNAGLVKEPNSPALDFCSEPEASALECYNAASQLSLRAADIFTVVDAGGGTVDLTSYQVIDAQHLSVKEVDVGRERCLYRGSTFVDVNFANFLHHKLMRDYPGIYRERHLIRGVREFTSSTKIQFSNSNRNAVYLQLSDDDEYSQGCIELQWSEIQACFDSHVSRIVEAVVSQVTTPAGRSKVVFCSGGFGGNDYLRAKLAEALPGVQILQPGDKSAGSKAVSLGAVRYAMHRSVRSRTSPAWYGVKAFRLFSSADQAIAGMASHKRLGKSGRSIVDNTFSLVLGKGEDVDDGEWRNAPFSLELLDDLQQADVRMGTIRLYESNREDRPHFIDSIGVNFLCKVDVYIPPHCTGRVIPSTDGQGYRAYDIVVWLSLGRADMKTRVTIDGVEAGGAIVSWS